jgi:hypothetical protein
MLGKPQVSLRERNDKRKPHRAGGAITGANRLPEAMSRKRPSGQRYPTI